MPPKALHRPRASATCDNAGSKTVAGAAAHAAAPASPPEHAPDAHPVEALELARQAFRPEPNLRDLRGDPLLLAVLDDLEPGHPDRAGLRCQLWHRRADGKATLVPILWEQDLPTLERVAALVQAGHLEPGDYTVQMRKAGMTAPPIRYSIARLEAPGLVSRGGELDQAGRLVQLMAQLRQLDQPAALPQGEEGPDPLEERLAALEKNVAQLTELAAQLVAGKESAGGAGGILGDLLLRVLTPAAKAEPEPETLNPSKVNR